MRVCGRRDGHSDGHSGGARGDVSLQEGSCLAPLTFLDHSAASHTPYSLVNYLTPSSTLHLLRSVPLNPSPHLRTIHCPPHPPSGLQFPHSTSPSTPTTIIHPFRLFPFPFNSPFHLPPVYPLPIHVPFVPSHILTKLIVVSSFALLPTIPKESHLLTNLS